MHQCVQANLARDSIDFRILLAAWSKFRAFGQNLPASCLAPRKKQGLPFRAPAGVPISERLSWGFQRPAMYQLAQQPGLWSRTRSVQNFESGKGDADDYA